MNKQLGFLGILCGRKCNIITFQWFDLMLDDCFKVNWNQHFVCMLTQLYYN